MTSQSRTMKFIFSYAFSFFSFQVSERIRHQISVFSTFQIGAKKFFVFFSVMSFSSTASSSPISQSAGRIESKFKFKKFRSMTDAIQMNGAKPSTNASSSRDKQIKIEKKIQIFNIFAMKILMKKLTQKCFCKNDVV